VPDSAERLTSVLQVSQTTRIEARTVSEIITDQGGLDRFLGPETTPGITVRLPQSMRP
jgi:hypothetical protein